MSDLELWLAEEALVGARDTMRMILGVVGCATEDYVPTCMKRPPEQALVEARAYCNAWLQANERGDA